MQIASCLNFSGDRKKKKRIVCVCEDEKSACISQASPNSTTVKTSADDQKILNPVLAGLVLKGTITQLQSNSITAAVSAARIAAETAKDAAKSFERALKVLKNDGNHSAHEALIALTLGIDVRTLHVGSKAGESLATIAGVKKDALIAALVLDQTKRIDAFVVAGKIKVAQATILKAGLVADVTSDVNAVGDRKGGHHKGDRIGHSDNDNNRN